MEMTYELWRALMYGVGVFVTCNAGGWALRRVAAGLVKPRADGYKAGKIIHSFSNPDELADFLGTMAEAVREEAREKGHVDGAPEAVAEPMEPVARPGGQSFEEMRRQTEAGRKADPDDVPGESGAADGESLPYAGERYKLRAV